MEEKRTPQISELTDEELGNVVGGACVVNRKPSAPPAFQPGDHVLEKGCVCCSMGKAFPCRSTYMVVGEKSYYYQAQDTYSVDVFCPVCHAAM